MFRLEAAPFSAAAATERRGREKSRGGGRGSGAVGAGRQPVLVLRGAGGVRPSALAVLARDAEVPPVVLSCLSVKPLLYFQAHHVPASKEVWKAPSVVFSGKEKEKAKS